MINISYFYLRENILRIIDGVVMDFLIFFLDVDVIMWVIG